MEQEQQKEMMDFLKEFISFENEGNITFPEIRNVVTSIIPIFYKIHPQIKDQLKEAEELQNFKQNIHYVCDGCGIHNVAEITWNKDIDERYISVYETFLPLFWSLCYFVLYTYDKS